MISGAITTSFCKYVIKLYRFLNEIHNSKIKNGKNSSGRKAPANTRAAFPKDLGAITTSFCKYVMMLYSYLNEIHDSKVKMVRTVVVEMLQ